MTLLQQVASPRGIIARGAFATTLAFSLASKVLEPAIFMQYAGALLKAGSSGQTVVLVVVVAVETMAIAAFLLDRTTRWPFLAAAVLYAVMAVSLVAATGIDMRAFGGCFGAFVKVQTVSGGSIAMQTALALSAFAVWNVRSA